MIDQFYRLYFVDQKLLNTLHERCTGGSYFKFENPSKHVVYLVIKGAGQKDCSIFLFQALVLGYA